ncbi:hypothetical protein WI74_17695 [Burkholderia ubonensis]|nr:hypothetical protein WI74_17695 [Burkholderia ubonensis]
MELTMTASRAARAPQRNTSSESPVTAFWKYIQAQAPHFTLSAALNLVAGLQPLPADPKVLAKKVRESLSRVGINLKHMSALQAASRLQGANSWYTLEDEMPKRLRFFTFDIGHGEERTYASWNELAGDLRDWADRVQSQGHLPLGVLQMGFTDHTVELRVPKPADDPNQMPQVWPLATISYIGEREGWLADSPVAFEKLRRHLEESHKGVLDGYAAFNLCAQEEERPAHHRNFGLADLANTELVLMREDDEDFPINTYEIARGNELTCWHQLELSLRKDGSSEIPVVNITVPTEGVGAWIANGIRYTWTLETLCPHEFVPGLTQCQIGIDACERLHRRYLLAKRAQGATFKFHEQTESLTLLSQPPEEYRVSLHRVLHILNKAGLTWESYCEQYGIEDVAMQEKLPVGFVFGMLKNLKVEDVNGIFAKPNLSEMALAEDSGLLCALLPRLYAVRYARPADLANDIAEQLREAVDNFSSGLQMQKWSSSQKLSENELPYLLYANEPADLLAIANDIGLKTYAAVIPHLFSTKGVLPESSNVWPWAYGNALYLRFEHAGDAA